MECYSKILSGINILVFLFVLGLASLGQILEDSAFAFSSEGDIHFFVFAVLPVLILAVCLFLNWRSARAYDQEGKEADFSVFILNAVCIAIMIYLCTEIKKAPAVVVFLFFAVYYLSNIVHAALSRRQ